MRFFTWPPIVDLERQKAHFAPIHILSMLAGAALLLLGVGLTTAVLP